MASGRTWTFYLNCRSSNDAGHGPDCVGAERINNRHECRFGLAARNQNDVVGPDRHVLVPAAHHGADVYRDFPLLAGSVFTEYHGPSWGGRWDHALGQRDGLAKRRSFFERERSRRLHLASHKEDIRWRNVNDV